jgi:hypothetical protein
MIGLLLPLPARGGRSPAPGREFAGKFRPRMRSRLLAGGVLKAAIRDSSRAVRIRVTVAALAFLSRSALRSRTRGPPALRRVDSRASLRRRACGSRAPDTSACAAVPSGVQGILRSRWRRKPCAFVNCLAHLGHQIMGRIAPLRGSIPGAAAVSCAAWRPGGFARTQEGPNGQSVPSHSRVSAAVQTCSVGDRRLSSFASHRWFTIRLASWPEASSGPRSAAGEALFSASSWGGCLRSRAAAAAGENGGGRLIRGGDPARRGTAGPALVPAGARQAGPGCARASVGALHSPEAGGRRG